ncbi:MAG: hypothetical protein ACON5H_06950 [Akkermansiaceae bacterium]
MIFDSSILACSTCASAFEHGGGNAGGWAIAVMLMTIVPLACGVLFFMIRMARREKTMLDPQYVDDYVPPTQDS